MRFSNNNLFSVNTFVKLKKEDWFEKQRVAGTIASQTLLLLENLIKEKTTMSIQQMNDLAEDYIVKNGGIPTFKNYKGFPAGVCISVNKQLVHGIPSDLTLKNGDLISFDLGVTYEGAIADTAITCIFGEPINTSHINLIKATEEALFKGIEAIGIGKRLDCIGSAISKFAKEKGLGVIVNYGGHGLDWNTPHAQPFVSNKGDTNSGIRIQPGLTIAIEPMLVIGSIVTSTSADGWTVSTEGLGSHQEHSMFIHDDHVEVVTYRGNENYLKSNKLYFK